jgi:hypothetical protein
MAVPVIGSDFTDTLYGYLFARRPPAARRPDIAKSRYHQVQSPNSTTKPRLCPCLGCHDIGNEGQVINDASPLACHRSIGNLSGNTADSKAGGKSVLKRERAVGPTSPGSIFCRFIAKVYHINN